MSDISLRLESVASLFSLCSYGMYLTVGIILVNLYVTFSSFDISSTMCGDHATIANLKCSITYGLHNLTIIISFFHGYLYT